jgi:hypothetical protein
MGRRSRSPSVLDVTRKPRLPLLTALGGLVVVSVMARPSALITFGLVALAGSLNCKRQPHRQTMR